MVVNWHKIRVEYGGQPATHTTFYRACPLSTWTSGVILDLIREFPGARHVHIESAGRE